MSAAPTALAQASRILKSLEAEGDAMSKMHTSLRNHLTRLQVRLPRPLQRRNSEGGGNSRGRCFDARQKTLTHFAQL